MINKFMEYLDVVNEQDEVIKQVSYDDIYKYLLRHRIVHILIFNKSGEMAMQKRSRQKSFCPEYWSTAVGGHVQAGETYKQGALREMKEEFGIELELKFLFKDYYQDITKPKLFKFLGVYRAKYEGGFNLNSREVEVVEYFSLDELQVMIKSGEKIHPELLFILAKHFNIKR